MKGNEMKGTLKRSSKVVALTGAEVVIEAGANAYHKTLGRMGRSVAHTYWNNRAIELHDEIKACTDCTADRVQTGNWWSRVRTPIGGGEPKEYGACTDYCDKHSPEVKKIINGYNNTLKD